MGRMSTLNLQRLSCAGIDYQSGIKRFIGDWKLYEAVLGAFLEDTSLERAQLAMKKNDRDALLECAHELKGSSGNTDMTALYTACCTLVTLLREGDATDAEVKSAFERMESAYLIARDGIRRASEE